MLVRFLKNHTPYLAGETASFPDGQAAAFISGRVAVAAAASPDGAAEGLSAVAEQLDSLLAGFRQRGIEVDHATPIGDLVSRAASIMAVERSAYEAATSGADAATGPTADDEAPVSGDASVDGEIATDPQPEATTDGQRRTVTPPRVARSAK